MLQLILASKSPRRKKLLTEHAYNFQADSIDISELLNKNLSLEASVEDLARQKASAYVDTHKDLNSRDYLLLSADTVVAFADKILGKPKNISEAKDFLCYFLDRCTRL